VTLRSSEMGSLIKSYIRTFNLYANGQLLGYGTTCGSNPLPAYMSKQKQTELEEPPPPPSATPHTRP